VGPGYSFNRLFRPTDPASSTSIKSIPDEIGAIIISVGRPGALKMAPTVRTFPGPSGMPKLDRRSDLTRPGADAPQESAAQIDPYGAGK